MTKGPTVGRLSFWQLIGCDITQYAQQAEGFQVQRPGLLRRASIVLTPSVSCVILHRIAHGLHRRRWYRPAWAAAMLNAILHRIFIDPASQIGPALYIPHPSGVIFRGRAGRALSLYTTAIVGPLAPVPFDGRHLVALPVLGDNITLGANCQVLGPVRVGSDVRVGPGATITADVPAGATVVAGQYRPQATRPAPGAPEAVLPLHPETALL